MYSRPYVFWYYARRTPGEEIPSVWTRDSDGINTFQVSEHRWMWQAKLYAAWRNFRRPTSMKLAHLEWNQRRCH